MSEKLPPFPKRDDYVLDCTACHLNAFYEHARYLACLSRLKVACEGLEIAYEALGRSYDVTEWPGPGGNSFQEGVMQRVGEAIAAIGSLPEE